MRKIILLLICLLISIVSATSFVGCGENSEKDSSDKVKKEESVNKNDKDGEDEPPSFTPVSDGGNYIPNDDYA